MLDGAVPIDRYVRRAGELGMKHLAITDHGNLFGALHFEKACRRAGISPLIGCEIYLAPRGIADRSPDRGPKNYHFLLLCRNETGYRNLMALTSIAYLEGFYYRPRVDDEILARYKEGLIASSACLAGEIPRKIVDGRYDEAKEKALFYEDMFGKGNFYLEIMNHGIEEEEIVRKALIRMSRETSIPLIATNDIHYLTKDQAEAQDILICIGTGKKLTDTKRLKMDRPEFYMKTQEEMFHLFPEVPEALANTLKVAEQCHFEIPRPGPVLPDYRIPEGFANGGDYLRSLTRQGIKSRYRVITEEIRQRTEYELDVLIKMGYTGYFLIVWDFIHWTKNRGIPVGPGRGSGAGSLVAYALGITDVDPLKYGLIFERFLNPERVSMPDFDIDFCFERREEVIQYITRKYGKEQVAGICTFGTLKTKAVIKDVARVLDIPFEESNRITGLVPGGKAPDGRPMSTEVVLETVPELKTLYDEKPQYRRLFDTAKVLEGMNRHISTHACGIVIGKTKLTDYVPLYKDQKTRAVSSEYSMDIIEDCGLVKMDILGLKTLTILRYIETEIRKEQPDFSLKNIPEDDPPTFKMLGEGKSSAVFQFESSGMQDILRKVKPGNIEDLIALNALYRPGPMQFIPQFIDAKHGRKPIHYPDPSLAEVLKPTYGIIVYQEQVMKVAQIIAGFSLGKADILRRAMGKKKEKEMMEMKTDFIKGAVERGYSEKKADEIFELLIPFAGYGFNKSHAAAYSVLAYQTAYCRANYPGAFMAANLSNEIGNPTSFRKYLDEAQEMGLSIYPPDINLSDRRFSVQGDKIFYGLAGIKGLGSAVAGHILETREEKGAFLSFMDFLEKVDFFKISRKPVQTMIEAGVFDKLSFDGNRHYNRQTLMHNLPKLWEVTEKNKRDKDMGQNSLFEEEEIVAESSVSVEEQEEISLFERLKLEEELLGFYLSGHPLDSYRMQWEAFSTLDLRQPDQIAPGRTYHLLGLIKHFREIQTRKGLKMAVFQVEDFYGNIEFIAFPAVYEQFAHSLKAEAVLGFTGLPENRPGEPLKMKLTEVKDLSALPKEGKRKGGSLAEDGRSIHVAFRKRELEESILHDLRTFCQENAGKSPLIFHLDLDEAEVRVKATSYLNLSGKKEIFEQLKKFEIVKDVWKE